MSASGFLRRQITHIRWGGGRVFVRKAGKALRLALSLPFYIVAVPAVVAIRLVRPWLLVRMSALKNGSLGHLAGDTELYLCERDAGVNQPGRSHADLLYIPESPCNLQLAAMWRRVLRIWPSWVLTPIHQVDLLIPGNRIPGCADNTQTDQDVHNLLDRIPPHLHFTPAEEARGAAGMRRMGIPPGKRFVCLNVRDNAWNAYADADDAASYDKDESSRNTDIQNYVLAAEALADRGYVVVRMGAIVREAIRSGHPGVIDYATNGMRSDFMDIYLGAKCEFCVSVGSGFAAVPTIFRRPIAYVNYVPLAGLVTGSAQVLSITQHFRLQAEERELTLAEIIASGAWLIESRSDEQASGVRLVENSPEEIRDLALEMAQRLEGTWRPREGDEILQRRFSEIFRSTPPEPSQAHHWRGELRSRFGAAFLRDNRAWLK